MKARNRCHMSHSVCLSFWAMVFQWTWNPLVVQDLPALSLPPWHRELQTFQPCLAPYMGTKDLVSGLMFSQQVLYLLSHLPSPYVRFPIKIRVLCTSNLAGNIPNVRTGKRNSAFWISGSISTSTHSAGVDRHQLDTSSSKMTTDKSSHCIYSESECSAFTSSSLRLSIPREGLRNTSNWCAVDSQWVVMATPWWLQEHARFLCFLHVSPLRRSMR